MAYDRNPSPDPGLSGHPVFLHIDGSKTRAATHAHPTPQMIKCGDFVHFLNDGDGRVRLGRVEKVSTSARRGLLFYMEGWNGVEMEVSDLRRWDEAHRIFARVY